MRIRPSRTWPWGRGQSDYPAYWWPRPTSGPEPEASQGFYPATAPRAEDPQSPEFRPPSGPGSRCSRTEASASRTPTDTSWGPSQRLRSPSCPWPQPTDRQVRPAGLQFRIPWQNTEERVLDDVQLCTGLWQPLSELTELPNGKSAVVNDEEERGLREAGDVLRGDEFFFSAHGTFG